MFGFSYWFLPLFAGAIWLGTLLSMLGVWVSMDIGATSWGKPTFIAGSAVTVVVFDLAFISERWLRHKGRLTQNYTTSEKILSVFAIIFAIIGAAGLILLTIFDTRRFHHVHDAMLVVFIVGYIISAIFICAEYQRLGIHYREHRILRASFWIKLAFIFVEVGLAIGFGVCNLKKEFNTAGVLEWTIALVYIFYVWSFIIDFLPATHTRNKADRFGPPIRRQDDEMAMSSQANGNMTGGPVYSSGGYHGETESYGSQQPIAQPGREYLPPQGPVPASKNF